METPRIIKPPELDKLEFEPVLAQVTKNWEGVLASAAQLHVPDEFINRVWKAEQCNFLLMIDKERTSGPSFEKAVAVASSPPPERANGRSLAKFSPGHYDHPHPALIFFIRAFDKLGHHERVELLLEPFVDWHGAQTL